MHNFEPTNLTVYSDEGIGKILQLSFTDKDKIYMITTTGIYFLYPDLKEPPSYIAPSPMGITEHVYPIPTEYIVGLEDSLYMHWRETASDWDDKGMAIICDKSGKVYWKKEATMGWITTISWGKGNRLIVLTHYGGVHIYKTDKK